MNESFVDDEFIHNVIDRYSDMILRVSFQYVRNMQDAEDVVQDVFLGLLECLSRTQFQSDEHMKAWLIRVAINKSKNAAKQNARRRKREELQLPHNSEHNQPQFDDLEELLKNLSALDREVVYLHYYEGYSAKEISENFVHKSEKSLFKRLSRAREKLKEFLSEGDR